MIAVQGVYDNGRIQLAENPPMEKAKVIVIFPEESNNNGSKVTKETARILFDEFTGSIKRDIDEKSERLGALDEKHSGVN